jgi:hypothetical protein
MTSRYRKIVQALAKAAETETTREYIVSEAMFAEREMLKDMIAECLPGTEPDQNRWNEAAYTVVADIYDAVLKQLGDGTTIQEFGSVLSGRVTIH